MDEVDPAGGEYNEPLFDIYRRGYDTEQVDRYLEQQQRRLGEANRRAGEAERRLGQAIDQLHSMSRRITQLEQSQQAQVPAAGPSAIPIDLLGDRVQRILQEAWDGAFALRQSVENEVTQLRGQAIEEATRIIDEAKSKAHGIESQMRRRREAYLLRAEQDKAKAVAQMTFLSDQRKAAIVELVGIKERIESAIVDVPTHTAANLSLASSKVQTVHELEEEDAAEQRSSRAQRDEQEATRQIQRPPSSTTHAPEQRSSANTADRPILRFGDVDLPPTLEVHHLPSFDLPPRAADTSSLVRSHRESTGREQPSGNREARESNVLRVFDFDAEEESPEP